MAVRGDRASRRTVTRPEPCRRHAGTGVARAGRDDRTARFVRLNSDLSRAFDPTGDGKRITTGDAYAGTGAAVGVGVGLPRPARACAPRQSVDDVRRGAGGGSGASVPGGAVPLRQPRPGDGRKDGVLLADLSRTNRDLCYLPVDTSEELLHLAVRGLVRRLGLPADRIMSLPWDFSLRESAAALRRLLDELFGATPVLFSLLGNTIAHFDDDLRCSHGSPVSCSGRRPPAAGGRGDHRSVSQAWPRWPPTNTPRARPSASSSPARCATTPTCASDRDVRRAARLGRGRPRPAGEDGVPGGRRLRAHPAEPRRGPVRLRRHDPAGMSRKYSPEGLATMSPTPA